MDQISSICFLLMKFLGLIILALALALVKSSSLLLASLFPFFQIIVCVSIKYNINIFLKFWFPSLRKIIQTVRNILQLISYGFSSLVVFKPHNSAYILWKVFWIFWFRFKTSMTCSSPLW
ncbi:unnamed protein product [Blepharisma stoltei]|uniref:Uncharacterized protein n=1 Tax=Blepharisma stoltei TaxID=1481888 RepID=A0AAU9JS16_9CILI|nr:unnamed protein product [Blepharisma stoltei]